MSRLAQVEKWSLGFGSIGIWQGCTFAFPQRNNLSPNRKRISGIRRMVLEKLLPKAFRPVHGDAVPSMDCRPRQTVATVKRGHLPFLNLRTSLDTLFNLSLNRFKASRLVYTNEDTSSPEEV